MTEKTAGERPRRIYALTDIAPETQAYALARYSRSAASLQESVAWISGQKAADFLETFYFAYGHRSIADMAHVTLALENISVLAAIEVENEQLWDGQERSTRYQDFTKSRYVTPPELFDAPAALAEYNNAADILFAKYTALTRDLTGIFSEVLPPPPGMDADEYKRTVKARVLDITRTLLPYATKTSVGQVTSARVLERQLARLLASRYAEVRDIAAEMKEVCNRPAFSPLKVRVEAALNELIEKYPEAETALRELAQQVEPAAPAPTLVKYAHPSEQLANVERIARQAVGEYLAHLTPDNEYIVRLTEPDMPLVEAVAGLLYRYSDLAYAQVQSVVRNLSQAVITEIYEEAHQQRGKHDDWVREQHAGYGRIYDILLDAKAMQDFFRHRRCIQLRQEITPAHGWVSGADWFNLGLPPEAAQQAIGSGLTAAYDETLQNAADAVAKLATFSPPAADYLLPLGFKRRALFKMDDAQAAYIIETRSQGQGHFAYRQAACLMWDELQRVAPEVARWVRVVNFEGIDYFKR
jgi:thymidylate synthase ThyX